MRRPFRLAMVGVSTTYSLACVCLVAVLTRDGATPWLRTLFGFYAVVGAVAACLFAGTPDR